jgi:hypothetical protein
MPYENYGQKGMSAKANTNAEGVMDEATDPVNEHQIAPENAETSRVVDASDNETATKRPKDQSKQH